MSDGRETSTGPNDEAPAPSGASLFIVQSQFVDKFRFPASRNSVWPGKFYFLLF